MLKDNFKFQLKQYNYPEIDIFKLDWEGQEVQDLEKEWIEMPEFIQDNQLATKKIIVNFKNQEDIKKFSTLICQKITEKTKYIWFPEEKKLSQKDHIYE